MTAPATLSTDRLTLRPFETAKHLTPAYVAWLNDAEVVRYSEQRHHTQTLESCRSFVESFTAGPGHLWAIEQASDGQHIGNIHADIDTANALADVAILIGARSVWGQGYGLEAWNAVLNWLFDKAAVRKVVAGCMQSNAPMLRIMEQSGMAADGTRKAHYLLDGQPEDVIFYARFART
ncbi:GNAT family N-acetyltransferase [Thalassospiraceae bacterium LMO-JJ14]|nr:GNAT family N-acetyltransferase [Thalassospiraceae bacterium LMO-JJ14]